MARTKRDQIALATEAEVDDALARIQELDAGLLAMDNDATQRIAEIKAATAAAKKPLADERKDLAAQVILHIEARRDEFAAGPRSRELNHGEIGYRLGNPKVSPLNVAAAKQAAREVPGPAGETIKRFLGDLSGKITERVILADSDFRKRLGRRDLIRVKPALDKEKALALYRDDQRKALRLLKECLLTVTQDDEPYFEPAAVTPVIASEEQPANALGMVA